MSTHKLMFLQSTAAELEAKWRATNSKAVYRQWQEARDKAERAAREEETQ